jgi:hypothetical protein
MEKGIKFRFLGGKLIMKDIKKVRGNIHQRINERYRILMLERFLRSFDYHS